MTTKDERTAAWYRAKAWLHAQEVGNDPCDEWPTFIRWEMTPDRRVRQTHGGMPVIIGFDRGVEPPRHWMIDRRSNRLPPLIPSDDA